LYYLLMSAPLLPAHVGVSAIGVVVALALGLGVLTATAGFAPWVAALVATATALVGYWALASEP
jgi:ABC-type enterochelin transport system permease subunit